MLEFQIPVLFGTESGNAEMCADALAETLNKQCVAAHSIDMADFEPDRLFNASLVLIITSTHGNGDPPSNAVDLLEFVQDKQHNLTHLRYAVCGLGDTAFAYFAQCGKDFDAALKARGATPIFARVDCDDHYEIEFARFTESVLHFFNGPGKNLELNKKYTIDTSPIGPTE